VTAETTPVTRDEYHAQGAALLARARATNVADRAAALRDEAKVCALLALTAPPMTQAQADELRDLLKGAPTP